MSIFKTWDAIAEYVTNTLGYEYLTNPKSWIDAFKDVVSDARYVGDNTYYSPTGFNGIDWINVGKPNAPLSDGGVLQPPSVTNIITDSATGGAVIGESAVALEQVGITIELSVAGYFATALAGLGLGVASYEAFPEFWTDISNYVFDTELTPQETEPFLRKKISALLSADTNDGKPVTYIPEELVKKTYDFLKTHINVTEVSNTFPTAVIDQVTGNITSGSTQTMPYLETTFLSKSILQSFVDNVVEVLHNSGYTHTPNVNINELYEEMQSELDLSDLDLITYQCGYDWDLWNNGFINDSSDGKISYIGVNGYKLTQVQKSEICLLKKARKITSDSIGFLTTISPNVSKKPDVSGCLYITSPPHGGTPTTQVYVAQNDTAGLNITDYDGGFGSLQRYVGIYPYPVNGEGSASDGGFNGWIDKRGTYIFRASNPIEEEEADLDEYLNGKAVITGKTPQNGTSFEDRYPERQNDKKQVSQPDKNGNDNQNNFIKGTAPISDNTTEQVIKHGVNNEDADSYKEEQDDNTNGKNTPNKASADDVNDSVNENIDKYNNSQVNPDTAPEPAPETQPLPQYPTTPPTEPEGDSGDTPTPTAIGGVTASGMVSVYNPTKQQLIDFSGWLWSPSFLDNFLKIFANPMDAIIGLHIMYATPISGGSEHIIAGYLDSNISSKVVTQQYSKIDCGTVDIPEYYGNATDYEPYTTVHIYLPFIGIMPLRANDVLGKRLKVEYGVDALTGTCLATITTIKDGSEIACYTFAGNCAVQIPVSGGNYAEMIKAISGFIVAGAGAIATGNPIMALGAGASIMSGNTSVQHSGAIGSNAGACGIRKPYIIITRKKAYNAQNYQHYYGFPANKHVKLSECKGYTQVKSCHVESIYRATDNEKQEIDSLLKQGVIII